MTAVQGRGGSARNESVERGSVVRACAAVGRRRHVIRLRVLALALLFYFLIQFFIPCRKNWYEGEAHMY